MGYIIIFATLRKSSQSETDMKLNWKNILP